jgi:hypothetical protein
MREIYPNQLRLSSANAVPFGAFAKPIDREKSVQQM